MNIAVIGGAGFVGAQLSFFLMEQGHNVTIMDNLARRGSELNLPEIQARGIRFIHGDVRSPEDVATLPSKTDIICHTAAQPSAVTGYDNPMYDINSNLLGLMNVLEFSRLNNSGLIFWSTNKVYSGDQVNQFPRVETPTRWEWDSVAIQESTVPAGFDCAYGFSEDFSVDGGEHSIYGLSKIMGDMACQEYASAFGIPTIVNRFSCIAGPGQFGKAEQGWVTWFAIALQFEYPIDIFGWNGKQVRDILFIDDLCELVELQIQNIQELGGQVFNVGGGIANALSTRQLCFERRPMLTR